MSSLIGALRVTLGLDSAAFEKGASAAEKRMAKMERSIEGYGKKLTGFGKTLSLGVTAPLVALGKASVDGFVEQEKAMADVEAALKSMGSASGKTAAELLKTSDALELASLYDGDVILKQVTANLLTFGNVAGKQFDRAQQAALDMATRLGGEPRAAAIQLGKALNDPVKGITALTRVGVQFTDKQQAAIKALVKTGDVAGAQGIILAEVEKQFKGAAAAAADASPWRKAQVAIGQAGDAIGAAILPIIKPVGEAIASMARAFASLPEPVQKFAVVAGIAAAALGPVLIGLGSLVSLGAPLLASLTAGATGAAAIGGALGTLAAVLIRMSPLALGAYIAWKNWDDIAPRLTPIIGNLRDIAERLGLLGPKAKEAGDATRTAASDMDDLGTAASNASKMFQSWADRFDAYNKRTAESARANHTTIQDGLKQLWQGFESFVASANAWGARVKAMLADWAGIGRDMMLGLVRGIRENASAVWAAIKGVVQSGIDRAKALLGIQSPSRVFMEIGDFIGEGLAIGIEGKTGRVTAATKKMTEAARKAAEETKALFARLFPEVDALNSYRADLQRIDTSGRSADAQYEARVRLGREFKGNTGEIPIGALNDNTALDVTRGLDETLKAIGQFGEKAKGTTVAVAKSFQDMAQGVLSSLDRLAGAIKGGGFLDILSGVIGLGLQLGGAGLFGSKVASRINKVPGYAGGTGFHPGGLAMVGERGPELVDLPRGSKVYPSGTGPGSGSRVEVIPSPYFDVVVDGRVMRHAPAVMQGGATIAQAQIAQRQRRRVA